MKITLERHIKENKDLVFTITCSEPHSAPFTDVDRETFEFLDTCKEHIQTLGNPESPLNGQVCTAIHNIKRNTFERVRKNLVFEIQQGIETKIHHVCTEVYNWIYDYQAEQAKQWMQEFDPQRTKYYFSNDRSVESDYDD